MHISGKMSKEIAEEYASSLADLKVNSKPLINMLTILAEENIDHAEVIVDTVEKHLEKVQPEIKLPVLYLVDSIIKNVGGAYTQRFSSSIVNMFTRTFKQVDEKTRSQMFKLRETWHEVFPSTKLYQLDVKVNLIDPAWPIQAQPHHSQPQATIHVNPNFLKKPAPVKSPEEEEEMRLILAKKEQELLMLQRKKVEIELEQTRKQLQLAEKSQPAPSTYPATVTSMSTPSRNIAGPPVIPPLSSVPVMPVHEANMLPAKARLGPPVPRSVNSAKITPVSGAMLAAARRDPRLTRRNPSTSNAPNIPSNLFDIKPLRNKRKAITIDVQPELVESTRRTEVTRRDPRLDKRNRDEIKRNRDENKRNRDDDRRNRDEEKRNNRDEDIRNNDEPTKDEDIRKNNIENRRKARNARKEEDKQKKDDKIKEKAKENDKKEVESPTKMDNYIKQVVDPKIINKLPPIPKLNRDDKNTETNNKKKEIVKEKRKKKDMDNNSNSCDSPSPDKKNRGKGRRNKESESQGEPDKVQFKELKNFNKERYMRRNKEKSESPEKATKAPETKASKLVDPLLVNKDVDLRVLAAIPEPKPAPITQKRSSTEVPDVLSKKSKVEKFDILFGNEDVDLRQLPQVEETVTKGPDSPKLDSSAETATSVSPLSSKTTQISPLSPVTSPKQDWNQVKEKSDDKKKPSKLDLVRAKLAKATEGKDRDSLGRPLLFSKSPSLERERKRTISSEDQDLRNETEDDVNKETISLILSQAKEHFKDGKMDKNQYNTLMFQVMQLNEKLKLKEAKQRESLENSKRKLQIAQKANESKVVASPKSSPRTEHNKFGDIDERITPAVLDNGPNSNDIGMQDLDLRMGPLGPMFDKMDPVLGPMGPNFLPMPPMMPFMSMPGPMPGPGPMNGPRSMPRPGSMPMPPVSINSMPGPGPFPPMWRGPMPKDDFNGPRRGRAPAPFFRGNFERLQRPTFEPRFVAPIPKFGMCQGECPLPPYERSESPPVLGTPGPGIPPTDYKVLEYIDQDPMKTIEIDGVPREIRFYGETAVIMLDWDDPREICFLPGSRRITFDNKDSVVLNFNDEYRQVEIDDQMFDIRLGAPTRELFINGKWYECFFGATPIAIMIEGKPVIIQLEGPPPQVDIGKDKRIDFVAGKINLIVDAQHMCPLFLDSKVQKFFVDGHCYTIRFADAFKTVLINERPYKVEFGGLPKPIFVGKNKHFIRFSVLPRHVKPGQTVVANMQGKQETIKMEVIEKGDEKMDVDQDDQKRPERIISPDGGSNHGGLDMLASLMPSSMAPASSCSGYSAAEPKFGEGIPGLETPKEEVKDSQPNPLSILGNINVNDLFAKLVATGIVPAGNTAAEKGNQEPKEVKIKEDTNTVHYVDLLKPETLRVKQPAVVAALYGGMQCSGCGARFPPEHTVRYSQHLDWHFRQNRRDRDSARRAVSRLWHYDLGDWLQYEEYTDQHDAEKNWFDTAADNPTSPPPELDEELPSVRAGPPVEHTCALCGDKFDQFYNEDKDEWHLRKAIRFEDKNYHPLCFEDYKVSLEKEKEKEEVATPTETIEESLIDKTDQECIEILEGDEVSQSGSDVEVLDNENEEPVEIEDTYIESGDEDDVVLKTEPVVEVEVDDGDTDDETREERANRDYSKVVVKQEPVDPDDEPIITAEEEAIRASADTTHNFVLSSIDGNLQLETTPQIATSLSGGIRINITKPISSTAVENTSSPMSKDDLCAGEEPLPPGEEPEITYTVKDSLKGVELSRQPPVSKGNELSGLCSIM